MTELRKSARQTEARRRAREKAAEFRAREDVLEKLAADYFVAVDAVSDIDAEAEKEIAAVRSRAEQKTRQARETAQTVIVGMLDLGIPRSEVAERLGVTVREVKRPTAEPVSEGEPPSTTESDASNDESSESDGGR